MTILIITLFLLMIAILILNEQLRSKLQPGNNRKNKIKSDLKLAKKSDAEGIIFGIKKRKGKDKILLYSPSSSEGHIAVCGGSGTGKTASLLINCLLSWTKKNPKNSSLSIDISGDISTNIDMPNKLVYEPGDFNSIPYNIFGTIDSLESEQLKNKALSQLALLIMPPLPATAKGSGSEYYTNEGRKILTASLIAFYHENIDFIDICKMIVENSWQNLFNKIDETKNETAMKIIGGFQGVEANYIAGAKQEAEGHLQIFATDEILAETVRRPKENEDYFEPSMVENHNCFIVIPDKDLEYYASLVEILCAQCLDFFKDRSLDADHQILFCLDEATSFTHIDLLPALAKYRKRKIRLMVCTQSLSAMDLVWGEKKRDSMMTNFKYKVVLEASLPKEQRFWADLAGYKTVISKSKTTGKGSESFSLSERQEYKIEPSEFANLGNELIVFYPGGFERLKKNFYFED